MKGLERKGEGDARESPGKTFKLVTRPGLWCMRVNVSASMIDLEREAWNT